MTPTSLLRIIGLSLAAWAVLLTLAAVVLRFFA